LKTLFQAKDQFPSSGQGGEVSLNFWPIGPQHWAQKSSPESLKMGD